MLDNSFHTIGDLDRRAPSQPVEIGAGSIPMMISPTGSACNSTDLAQPAKARPVAEPGW
jgi:hypothetical protein